MDVHVKFGDSTLNRGQIIRLLAGRTRLRTFVENLVAFCGRPEADNEVILSRFVRLIVSDKCVKIS